jgi:nucleotide-binding universal stress UspA family protein
VVHVVSTVPEAPYPHHWEKERSEALLEWKKVKGLGFLDDLVLRIEEKLGGYVAGSHYREGTPHKEVVRLGEEIDAGLIMVGGRRLNWFERIFLTGYSERASRRAKCLVLVVGGGGMNEVRTARPLRGGPRVAPEGGIPKLLSHCTYPSPKVPVRAGAASSRRASRCRERIRGHHTARRGPTAPRPTSRGRLVEHDRRGVRVPYRRPYLQGGVGLPHLRPQGGTAHPHYPPGLLNAGLGDRSARLQTCPSGSSNH